MEIRYTSEELQGTKQLILVELTEEGFKEKIIPVTKCTPKKIYFDKTLNSKYSCRNQLYYEEVGGKIAKVGKRLVTEVWGKHYHVSESLLVMEKDVEQVKDAIKQIAKEQILRIMVDLNKQLECIE